MSFTVSCEFGMVPSGFLFPLGNSFLQGRGLHRCAEAGNGGCHVGVRNCMDVTKIGRVHVELVRGNAQLVGVNAQLCTHRLSTPMVVHDTDLDGGIRAPISVLCWRPTSAQVFGRAGLRRRGRGNESSKRIGGAHPGNKSATTPVDHLDNLSEHDSTLA